jgi:hypothetical protein
VQYLREMDNLNARFCHLPQELKLLVLSHIEQIKPPHILLLSLDVLEALSLFRDLQRTSYFEGVAGDDIADFLVRLLDDDRVRSLEKERAVELIGDENKDRLCEWACGRNFEVLKWAHNELDLRWAPYPAGLVSHILSLSLDVLEALSLLRDLQRTSYFEGVAGDVIADFLVRLLDDDRVRSLEKERAVELIGDENKDRLCEYACGRNFEVLKWAHNELDLRWAPYPAGRVSDDVLVLRVLRGTSSKLERRWREDLGPEEWDGVTMISGRVVELKLLGLDLDAVSAEIGQLTSLEVLHLRGNRLEELPAEIGQLTSLRRLYLGGNQLTSVPAEIGQLRALTLLYLGWNKLTSVPAEIGQLASLERLALNHNQLTSLPAEFRQLASLQALWFGSNQLTSLPGSVRDLRAAGCLVSD